MPQHLFILDFNVKDTLKVLAISGRIECVFYFCFIYFNLLLHVFKMVFSIVKVQLLYFVLF
jgi:hypothetical protein